MFGATDAPGVYGQVPATTAFTQVNFGSATITKHGQSLYLGLASSANNNVRGLVITAPATPYSLTVLFSDCSSIYGGSAYPETGLIFRESGTGKLQAFGSQFDAVSYYRKILIRKYNSPTSSASVPLASIIPSPVFRLVWLKIEDNGTNRICSFSRDGFNFVQAYSVARADGFTTAADQIGFYGDSAGGTASLGASIKSWVVA